MLKSDGTQRYRTRGKWQDKWDRTNAPYRLIEGRIRPVVKFCKRCGTGRVRHHHLFCDKCHMEINRKWKK